MNVAEIRSLSLVDLTTKLRSRELSAVELMEICLSRAEESREKLNVVVAQRNTDDLLADAGEADRRLTAGEARPLEGVPLGVKDLEDAAGLVTSMGSRLFADQVAKKDSTQVKRLRAAGAIVFGKTNTPEFGFTAITKNPVFGASHSPWNTDRTPGGSSGGSSAALTGGVLPLVTASDGGGSIRIPASFTGAFGLKPTFGRVPRGPIKTWNYGDTSCYGPLTKTVEDAALFLDQVVGPSPRDPSSLPHPGLSYVEAVRSGLPSALRIGYSSDLGVAVVQSDVATVVASAVAVFEELGHGVEELTEGLPNLGPDWRRLGDFEIAGLLGELLVSRREEITRSFLESLEASSQMTARQWGEAARARARLNDWCADVFERYDLLVTPTVPYDPPPARGPFPEETEGRPQVPVGVAAFTIPFNLSGHPAATVRAGMSDLGLPVGMQIVGPRHREDLVLQAARAFEEARPWHPDWPLSW